MVNKLLQMTDFRLILLTKIQGYSPPLNNSIDVNDAISSHGYQMT